MEKSSLGEKGKSPFRDGEGSILDEEVEKLLNELTISGFSSISSSANSRNFSANSWEQLELENCPKSDPNDTVLIRKGADFDPKGPSQNDVVSQRNNVVSLAQSSTILDLHSDADLRPIRLGPKWKYAAHKTIVLDLNPSPNSNLALDPHANSRVKPYSFRKLTSKTKGNFKNKRACYRCGKTGYFKANCPKTNGGKKQKEIAMTITEVMMVEPTTNSWWIDSATTRHITRSRKFFVDFIEKAVDEHKVYMGNNTYNDVLGEGKM
ncbi:uncharacterized protein LOC133860208 [Alnus glutinosa]|uniref:uncharacterized protein LOC133860208 n=1 Tax=Alnus glutinosa TaxID=3517 RepID=UPI002D7817FA|nr:uncharacterized protein LOC133860208 [Alnus glutinosa]